MEDNFNIHERPILLSDFIALDRAIDNCYRVMYLSPDGIQKIFEPVIAAACDQACNLAYELGFDNPSDIITEGYFRLINN